MKSKGGMTSTDDMTTIETPYGNIEQQLKDGLSKVKLLACDVDGVFSDGRLYMGNNGEELKTFHTKDGHGVKSLMAEGIEVAIITGRSSRIVTDRFTALGVKHIVKGELDKQTALLKLQQRLGLTQEQTCSIGDDIPDVGMFQVSGVAVAPADAHPTVLSHAHYTTKTHGGFGCVRELGDLILLSQDKLAGVAGLRTQVGSV